MAQWKKLVTSGSDISQLANDIGYAKGSGTSDKLSYWLDNSTLAAMSGWTYNHTSNNIEGTGAITASAFKGDGSDLTNVHASTLINSIVDGNGITDFTFNGSSGATISIDLDTNSGLTVASTGLSVASTIAGNGLTFSSGIINIGAGDGINVSTNTIDVNVASIAGAGLESDSSNNLRIAAAAAGNGLTGGHGNALSIDLDTNSGLIVSTNGLKADSGSYNIGTDQLVGLTGNGSLLIGGSSGPHESTLTAGDNISIANSDGAITINAITSSYVHPTYSGDDISVDTSTLSGATVISDLDFNITTDNTGHVTDATLTALSTRELTPADIGAAPDSSNITINGSAEAISVSGGTQGIGTSPTFTINLPNTVSVHTQLKTPQIASAMGTASIDIATNGDLQIEKDLLIHGSTSINGDLHVQGTTTTINTANLLVEDNFILVASGSTTQTDAGFIVQNTATTGTALFWDAAAKRWSYNSSGVPHNATSVTPEGYFTTVQTGTNETPPAVAFGSGEMYVNTSTSDIWIYA